MREDQRCAGEWQRLSPWSIVHFSAAAVAQHLQALIVAGAASYGAARWDAGELAWVLPLILIAVVLVGSLLRYHFYSYRLLEDAVEVRRGALFRESLDLTFTRIQNINVEHPFYLRPFARVTLTIDAAGASSDEVAIPALEIPQAEAIRRHILERRGGVGAGQRREAMPDTGDPVPAAAGGEVFFTRSVADLIIHGLTNNRAYFVLAGVAGVAWQLGFSPIDVAAWLGARFDITLVELSLLRIVLLVLASLVLAVAIIASLSVLESIVSFYGYTMIRTADGLTVRRGLLTRHEIHVKRSRIQTIAIQQDWIDRCLGRRNVVLEPISHAQPGEEHRGIQQKRIFVPSVRSHETGIITSEILPLCPVDSLGFTPVSPRYLYVRCGVVSVLCAAAFLLFHLVAPNAAGSLPGPASWLPLLLPVVWLVAILRVYLGWRRGGLAVHGDAIVVRSGAVGTEYRIFQADKIQDLSHIQSVLMRRHGLSSLRFRTASTTIRVPHMDADFMRTVVDYCLFRVESSSRSWM